jgi:hypothetical protein
MAADVTPALKRVTDVTPAFMGVIEAEVLSGISRWTWRAYCYKGTIESTKVGQRLLIPVSEITRILSEGRRPRVDGLPAGAPSAKSRHSDRSVTDRVSRARVHA